jgi:hypothetical protein
MRQYGLILHAISACTLSCEHCGQGAWRDDTPQYKLTLEQVKKLLDVSRSSGYEIKEIIISGGEPTLWKDLDPSLKLFKEYPDVVKTVTLFSNGTRPINEETIKNVNSVIISFYKGSSVPFIQAAREKCVQLGVKFKLKNKDKFYPWPKEAVPDSVPGRCVCPFMSLLGDEIAVCGEIFEIEKRYKVDASQFRTKVEVGFMNAFNKVRLGAMDICSMCIENMNVQQAYGKIVNLDERDIKATK